jgi:hypothetical protein
MARLVRPGAGRIGSAAMVGTRSSASAARPDAGRTLLDRRSLPREPTAFQCNPTKPSPRERTSGAIRCSRSALRSNKRGCA